MQAETTINVGTLKITVRQDGQSSVAIIVANTGAAGSPNSIRRPSAATPKGATALDRAIVQTFLALREGDGRVFARDVLAKIPARHSSGISKTAVGLTLKRYGAIHRHTNASWYWVMSDDQAASLKAEYGVCANEQNGGCREHH